MSLESEPRESRPPVDAGAPDLETLEFDDPDVGFQVGVGVCCGAILAGVVTTMLALAEAEVATLLATFPTAVTGGIVVGAILSRRARGVPERLGARRVRWLCALAPAVVFVGVAALEPVAPAVDGRVAFVALVSAVAVGLAGLLVAAMARNRYVDAVTTDDPAATWTWQPAGLLRWEYATGGVLVVVGIAQVAAGERPFGAFWAAYGAFLLFATAGQNRWFDEWGWTNADDATEYAPEFAVHDAGLVKSRGRTKTLVPWTTIDGVRLEGEELVIERRFLDVRCRTDPIDDPEAVRDALEARRRA